MWREYLKLRESLILRKEGSENWFSFYTSLGFFSEYKTKSESESKLEISNYYFEEWGNSFDPVDYFAT